MKDYEKIERQRGLYVAYVEAVTDAQDLARRMNHLLARMVAVSGPGNPLAAQHLEIFIHDLRRALQIHEWED